MPARSARLAARQGFFTGWPTAVAAVEDVLPLHGGVEFGPGADAVGADAAGGELRREGRQSKPLTAALVAPSTAAGLGPRTPAPLAKAMNAPRDRSSAAAACFAQRKVPVTFTVMTRIPGRQVELVDERRRLVKIPAA